METVTKPALTLAVATTGFIASLLTNTIVIYLMGILTGLLLREGIRHVRKTR